MSGLYQGFHPIAFPGPSVNMEASSSGSQKRTSTPTIYSNRSSVSELAGEQKSEVHVKRQRLRYKRSTRGCFTCRTAKVKCDETTPTCLRCKMNQRPCEWPDSEQLAHPRKSRKKARGSTAPGTPTTMSGKRDDLERDWREISALTSNERDRSISVTVDNGRYPVLPLGIPPDPVFIPHPNMQEPQSSGPHRFTARPDLPSSSPLDQSVTRSLDPEADPLPSLSNSLLANRRMTKGKQQNGAGIGPMEENHQYNHMQHHQPEEDNLLHGIALDSLANALDHDPPLIELGPVSVNTPIPQVPTTQALRSAFPSPLALQLFHHFANYASRILVTMGNNGPHKNPILTLCTPQRLLDTSSAAAAALRMSMLSTSVAHLENELTAREKRKGNDGVFNPIKERLQEVGRRLKTAALANIVLVEEDETDQFDTVLATCVILMMRDVISASDWSENFEYAIRLVSKRGGPQAVLSSDPTNFTRRFLLENLTTHDIFSCFITQKEPVLMDRFDPWWYSCIETSSRSWEWESVERTFGISRGMVEFIARVVTLNAQKRRLGVDFTMPAVGMHKVEEYMRRQAEGLLLELDVWHNGLSTLSQHVRVTCGDYIYKYMSNVFILAEILDQPIHTLRIISSIDYVLELCSEATALRQVVMLVWPLLICGTFCLPHVRDKVLSLMDAFEDDYCEDLRVAREIILEQWKCMDSGLGRQSFADLMLRIGKYVLLI